MYGVLALPNNTMYRNCVLYPQRIQPMMLILSATGNTCDIQEPDIVEKITGTILK